MGKVEIYLDLVPPQDDLKSHLNDDQINGAYRAKWEFRDPQSGRYITSGSAMIGSADQAFFGLLGPLNKK